MPKFFIFDFFNDFLAARYKAIAYTNEVVRKIEYGVVQVKYNKGNIGVYINK